MKKSDSIHVPTVIREVESLTIILTGERLYTRVEVAETFSSYLSSQNLHILQDHLTIPNLSEDITGFFEDEGTLVMTLGYGDEMEFIGITKKAS
ncbi:hypothetical protein [Flavobacterium sp.]|uniref:hypothetical protein n=1 Tax=Flavobacterium sp. TaxID=239 RepID=UPI0040340CC6